MEDPQQSHLAVIAFHQVVADMREDQEEYPARLCAMLRTGTVDPELAAGELWRAVKDRGTAAHVSDLLLDMIHNFEFENHQNGLSIAHTQRWQHSLDALVRICTNFRHFPLAMHLAIAKFAQAEHIDVDRSYGFGHARAWRSQLNSKPA